MIRVDYQKKSQLSDLQEPMPPDRGSTSPVSSIQGEFYSYLGISSKEDESTSPSKSALDDFDLSKRRSLRVRVVNKLKEHQAKMMKIAERTNAGGESPAKEAMRDEQEEEEDEGVCTPEREMHSSLSRMSRLDSQCSSRNGTAGDPSPNTILARRCYFNIKSSDASPSPTPSTVSHICPYTELTLGVYNHRVSSIPDPFTRIHPVASVRVRTELHLFRLPLPGGQHGQGVRGPFQ